MIRLKRAVISAMAVATVVALHSATPAAQQRAEAAFKRIAELSTALEKVTGGTPEEMSRRDEIAKTIRGEVQTFVETSVNPGSRSDEVQSLLRAVLRTQVPDFDSSDPPKARMVDVRGGRSLIVAYSVVRPPHFDLPTIAAFKREGDALRLVAETGEDFEGHTLATLDIASPVPGVTWFLAYGQAFTFNGSKMRFRLYAFDGNAFETIWSMDDAFSGSVKVLPDGFEITHYVRDLKDDVTEQYRSTTSGMVRVR